MGIMLTELTTPDFSGYAPINPTHAQEGDDLLVHDTFSNSWTVLTAERVSKLDFGNGNRVRISNDRVGFNIALGEDSPLAVFRKAKPLPEGIGAVIEFAAGVRRWRLIHTDTSNWALLREFPSGYSFNAWLTGKGASQRLAEATEVRIVTEGVIL